MWLSIKQEKRESARLRRESFTLVFGKMQSKLDRRSFTTPEPSGRTPLNGGINNLLVWIDFTSNSGIVGHANSADAIVGHGRHFSCTAGSVPAGERERERKEEKEKARKSC